VPTFFFFELTDSFCKPACDSLDVPRLDLDRTFPIFFPSRASGSVPIHPECFRIFLVGFPNYSGKQASPSLPFSPTRILRVSFKFFCALFFNIPAPLLDWCPLPFRHSKAGFLSFEIPLLFFFVVLFFTESLLIEISDLTAILAH